MRLTFQLEVEVNEHAWAEYNGVPLDEVADDVRTSVTSDPTGRFPIIAEADGTVTIH